MTREDERYLQFFAGKKECVKFVKPDYVKEQGGKELVAVYLTDIMTLPVRYAKKFLAKENLAEENVHGKIVVYFFSDKSFSVYFEQKDSGVEACV